MPEKTKNRSDKENDKLEGIFMPSQKKSGVPYRDDERTELGKALKYLSGDWAAKFEPGGEFAASTGKDVITEIGLHYPGAIALNLMEKAGIIARDPSGSAKEVVDAIKDWYAHKSAGF